jgi:hypothetical protein
MAIMEEIAAIGPGDLAVEFIDTRDAAFLAPIQESQEHIVPLLHGPLSGVVHLQMFQKALFENAGIRRFCIELRNRHDQVSKEGNGRDG